MQRTLAVGLFLVLALISALALPTEVENGFYPGRSGDFVLRPKDFVAGPAYMTLLAKNVKFDQTSFPETSVADLVAHLMGVAPLNPYTNRENFPRVNFYDMPRANVLFFVESSNPSGNVALTTESYPASFISRLTSVLTGTTPSQHGIIQRAWSDGSADQVAMAYGGEDDGASVATLQDLVTVAYAGNALVVSASARRGRMVATALAAKPAVLPSRNNNHAFYWDKESQHFASVYDESAQQSLLGLSFADVEAFVATLGSYDATTKRLSVEGVEFDLTAKCDVAFFAQLSFVRSLVAQLKTDERLKALVADKASDFFTFDFSFRGLEYTYGAESAQVRAAHSMLDSTINFATEEINALYNGRSMAEVVSFTLHAWNKMDKPVDRTESADYWRVGGQVYLTNGLSVDRESVHQQLVAALPEYDVYRTEGTMARARRSIIEEEELLHEYVRDGPNGSTTPTSDDVATFQIVIWTSVVLIFTALAASVVMASVHDTSDSVIYNSPALHAKSS